MVVDGVPFNKVRRPTGATRGKRVHAASSAGGASNTAPEKSTSNRPRSASQGTTMQTSATIMASRKGRGGKKKRRPRTPSPTPSTSSSASAPERPNSEAGEDASSPSQDTESAEAAPAGSNIRGSPSQVDEATGSSRRAAENTRTVLGSAVRRRTLQNDDGEEPISKRQRSTHGGWRPTQPIASTSSTPSMLGTPLPRDILDMELPPPSAFPRWEHGYDRSPYGGSNVWTTGRRTSVRDFDDKHASPAVRPWNMREGARGEEFEPSPRPAWRSEPSLFPDPFGLVYAVSSERDILPFPRRTVLPVEEQETGLYDGDNLLGLQHVSGAGDAY